jgi:hypothetical protein
MPLNALAVPLLLTGIGFACTTLAIMARRRPLQDGAFLKRSIIHWLAEFGFVMRPIRRVGCMRSSQAITNFNGRLVMEHSAYLASVIRYIERQEEHHRKMDFKAEYIKLLKAHGVEYDERYIWE